MSSWAPRVALETVLGELDDALARDRNDVTLLFARASILAELGRNDEAEHAYRAVLEKDPSHVAALMKLAVLMRGAGDWTAARSLLERAVAVEPRNAAAHVNLANLLVVADPMESRRRYETALSLQPDLPEAHQGLSALLAMLGDEENAARHRAIGFAGRAMRTRRYTGAQTPVPVVVLTATSGGNLDVSTMLDESRFLAFEIFADVFDRSAKLPAHELVINAIADADRSDSALVAAEELLKHTTASTINAPRAVRATSRAAIAERFASNEGIVVPKVARLSREDLTGDSLTERGFGFPLLLRAPGHHIGQHFHKVDHPAQVSAAVQMLPGNSIYAIEFLDTRGVDGSYRKYRVMIVGGELYPVHLAVSKEWKVHYFSSAMAGSESYRREEARFLDDMPAALGPQAMSALATIARELRLDYAGIDFALDAKGRLVLFEANAAMSIYQPRPDERWLYRVEPTRRVVDAIRRMVLAYCTPAT